MFRQPSPETTNHAFRSTSFIHECQQFRELLKHCTKDSLVALDLDNSTLRPTHVEDLGSDQWFRQVLRRAQEKSNSPNEAILNAVKLNNSVLALIPVKAVEPETANIVDSLQKQGTPVIAVTARRFDTAEATAKQLDNINIHFTNFAREIEIEIRLETAPEKRIIFKNGVLYCDGSNKGECLLELIKILRLAIDKIVMLDDSEKNLVLAKAAMEAKEVTFIGLRYNVLDERAAGHVFQRSNKKLSEVSSLFSRSVVHIIETLALTDEQKIGQSTSTQKFNPF